MKISKEVWKDVLELLGKHKIPYTSHLERRMVEKPMGQAYQLVHDNHIMINLIIPDYYNEIEEE